MARRQSEWEAMELLRQRRYQHDLTRWGEWQAQRDRLHELLPQALDVIEDTLSKSGPEALKVAMEVVKMSGVSGSVTKPQRILIDMADADELAAGLPEADNLPGLPDKTTR